MIEHIDGCPMKTANGSYCQCALLMQATIDAARRSPATRGAALRPATLACGATQARGRSTSGAVEDFIVPHEPPRFISDPETAADPGVFPIEHFSGRRSLNIIAPDADTDVFLGQLGERQAVPLSCPLCAAEVSTSDGKRFTCANGHHVPTVAEAYEMLVSRHWEAEREKIQRTDLTVMHSFNFGDSGAALPISEDATAMRARRMLASPRARIERVRFDDDPCAGAFGVQRVHLVATIDNHVARDLEASVGDHGGADDRLIADVARRTTGEAEPAKVAEALCAMSREVPSRGRATWMRRVVALGEAVEEAGGVPGASVLEEAARIIREGLAAKGPTLPPRDPDAPCFLPRVVRALHAFSDRFKAPWRAVSANGRDRLGKACRDLIHAIQAADDGGRSADPGPHAIPVLATLCAVDMGGADVSGETGR